jgi:chorismate mutase/prephenate dehydratase
MPENSLKPEQLLKLRDTIDSLDHRIIEALAERQRVVRQVISSKITTATQVRDLDREDALLKKIRDKAVQAGLDPYFAEQLFREIIFQSVRYQNHSLVDHQNELNTVKTIHVAYQGLEGAYSHLAALRHYRERYEEVICHGFQTIEEVTNAVENDEVQVGVLPIENTTAGSINDTYDLLGSKSLFIVGEEVFRVEHCLLTLEPVAFENIRRIISHPLTLVQCSKFLAGFKHTTIESFIDSAMSAQKVKFDADLSQAAIASPEAAEKYGLHILQHEISNNPDNFTRYVVIGKQKVAVDSQLPSKTSLILSTIHEKGALMRCLQVLDKYEINMSKLESRPRPDKAFQYQFYVDIEANDQDPKVLKALKELEGKAANLRVLGCYPKQVEE